MGRPSSLDQRNPVQTECPGVFGVKCDCLLLPVSPECLKFACVINYMHLINYSASSLLSYAKFAAAHVTCTSSFCNRKHILQCNFPTSLYSQPLLPYKSGRSLQLAIFKILVRVRSAPTCIALIRRKIAVGQSPVNACPQKVGQVPQLPAELVRSPALYLFSLFLLATSCASQCPRTVCESEDIGFGNLRGAP